MQDVIHFINDILSRLDSLKETIKDVQDTEMLCIGTQLDYILEAPYLLVHLILDGVLSIETVWQLHDLYLLRNPHNPNLKKSLQN